MRHESKLLFEGYQNPESKFSHFRDDSSYVYFNSAENVTTSTSNDLNLKVAINHNISDDVLYTVNFTRLRFRSLNTVDGKTPSEFSTAGLPGTLPSGSWRYSGISSEDFYTDPDNPYYVTAYDWPAYTNRTTTAYNLKADITSKKWQNHQFKTGVQFIYNDLDENSINFPGRVRRLTDGSLVQGGRANTFHNFNPEASYYVQDKWAVPGHDRERRRQDRFLFPGKQHRDTDRSDEIDQNVDKYKFQISPRLGFAFPITDRTSSISITDGSPSGRAGTSSSEPRTCSSDRAFSAIPISTRSSPSRTRPAFRTSSTKRSRGTSSCSTRTSSG